MVYLNCNKEELPYLLRLGTVIAVFTYKSVSSEDGSLTLMTFVILDLMLGSLGLLSGD